MEEIIALMPNYWIFVSADSNFQRIILVQRRDKTSSIAKTKIQQCKNHPTDASARKTVK